MGARTVPRAGVIRAGVSIVAVVLRGFTHAELAGVSVGTRLAIITDLSVGEGFFGALEGVEVAPADVAVPTDEEEEVGGEALRQAEDCW